MGIRSRWWLTAFVVAMVSSAAGADLPVGSAAPGATLYDFEGRPLIRVPAPLGGGCPLPPAREGAPATITNAPCDPTYVGSAYGLGRPSRDGLVPGPGFDDPYDRPLARRR